MAMSMSEFAAAEPLRLLPDLAAGFRQDLSGLEDRELLALASSLPQSSERRAAARNLLVARYRDLVRSCVQRYSRSPEPTEDLMQVGYVGLLKAIDRFDPARGFSLSTYARPCIIGEIKKHFRDKSWQVHVERSLQELVLQVRDATRRLEQQLGHTPAGSELASHLGVRDANIRDARRAELVLHHCHWTGRQAGNPAWRAWLNSSARKTPASSTCSACKRSPLTGANYQRASRRSWPCGSTAA
jgi:RNA polymerase sigma factor (sigma-70 family)